MPTWSFLTNHARVLLEVAGDPDLRLREIADAVGITERRVHAIVNDLANSGYLSKHRVGRRNQYSINTHRPLGQEVGDSVTVSDLLALLVWSDKGAGYDPGTTFPDALPPAQA